MFSIPKSLFLQLFTVLGLYFFISSCEPKTKVTIVSAVYGSNVDPQKSVDVLDIVNKNLVKTTNEEVLISFNKYQNLCEIFGDPAYGELKSLKIKYYYVYQNRNAEVVVGDHDFNCNKFILLKPSRR